MELKEFVVIIKKYFLFIVILTAAGAAVGFFSTRFFPSGFQRSQVYFVSEHSTDLKNSPNFNAENYYLQEKLRNATDTLVAILDSVDFQKEVLSAGDTLQVRKIAPQVMRLTYLSSSEQNATLKLDKVVDKFNTKISDLTEGSPTAQLKAVGPTAQPIYSRLNRLTLFFAGSLLGLVFALFIVGLKEYNKL